jgi:hypothetical protein
LVGEGAGLSAAGWRWGLRVPQNGQKGPAPSGILFPQFGQNMIDSPFWLGHGQGRKSGSVSKEAIIRFYIL